MRSLLKALIVPCPWRLKRLLLTKLFGYTLDPTSRIGFSWVFPRKLELGPGASIGHLNVAVHLDSIVMGESSSIGRGNWITGYPKDGPDHFQHLRRRDPSLYIGRHSAITKRHHIDCTERVTLGDFVTVAGYFSQILTHSIDIVGNRQDASPISVGDFSFVGTNCVILGGANLPAYSVLGAKSLLNKAYSETHRLYAGVPAKEVKQLPETAGYFNRSCGYVL